MTGYRTKLAGKYINEDRFMLTYGDAVANVDLNKLIDFHIKMDTIGTVTGVYPGSRFGDLVIQEDKVIEFKQKLKDVHYQKPINGGYFVFKREFLDYIPENPSIEIEKTLINIIVEKGQLSIFRHEDFWQCMDTYRDNQLLNKMWIENPVWKIWDY